MKLFACALALLATGAVSLRSNTEETHESVFYTTAACCRDNGGQICGTMWTSCCAPNRCKTTLGFQTCPDKFQFKC